MVLVGTVLDGDDAGRDALRTGGLGAGAEGAEDGDSEQGGHGVLAAIRYDGTWGSFQVWRYAGRSPGRPR